MNFLGSRKRYTRSRYSSRVRRPHGLSKKTKSRLRYMLTAATAVVGTIGAKYLYDCIKEQSAKAIEKGSANPEKKAESASNEVPPPTTPPASLDEHPPTTQPTVTPPNKKKSAKAEPWATVAPRRRYSGQSSSPRRQHTALPRPRGSDPLYNRGPNTTLLSDPQPFRNALKKAAKSVKVAPSFTPEAHNRALKEEFQTKRTPAKLSTDVFLEQRNVHYPKPLRSKFLSKMRGKNKHR